MRARLENIGVKRVLAALLLSSTVALAVGSTPPAQASISQPAVVSENPADTTPHIVLSDPSQDVRAFAQVGQTVYAGGLFNQVQDWARTTTYARQNFVAFDRETGVVSPLNLAFNGRVSAIEATADGTALFISGAFSKVNGITRRGLVKYDLVNNRIDPTFLPGNLRTVSDIKLANGAVIAAGNLAGHVVALDPTTGANTGAIAITVAGVVNPNDETRVRHIAVSPDGTRLVATGNFATVNGQGRKRAFMLNLGATATLSTWHAPRFDVDLRGGPAGWKVPRAWTSPPTAPTSWSSPPEGRPAPAGYVTRRPGSRPRTSAPTPRPPGSTGPAATPSTAWRSPERRCMSAATNAGWTTPPAATRPVPARSPARASAPSTR